MIAACALYDLTDENLRGQSLSLKRLLSLSKAYLIPLSGLALLWSVKYFYTARIMISRNSFHKTLQNVVAAICFFSPFNNMNAYWLFSRFGQDFIFLILAAAAVFLVLWLCFKKGNRAQRVSLGWCLLFIVSAVSAAELGPRYFYISSVGWAIFMAETLRRTAARIAKRPPLIDAATEPVRRRFAGSFAAALMFACVALQGVRHAAHLLNIWREGSAIIEAAVESTVEFIDKYPEMDNVIVVDQPTRFQGDDYYGAPLLIHSMRLPLSALRRIEHPSITSVSFESDNLFDRFFPRVSREEMEAASADPDTLVLRYDPDARRMVLFENTTP